jgi:hypothetical protein
MDCTEYTLFKQVPEASLLSKLATSWLILVGLPPLDGPVHPELIRTFSCHGAQRENYWMSFRTWGGSELRNTASID